MTRMLTELPDILRAAGLPVLEVPGADTRGHGEFDDAPAGLLCHHTAGPKSGAGVWPGPPAAARLMVPGYPSLRVVVDGRPGLTGPLCNLGLTRAGVWVYVAAGVAWHAGTGAVSWCPSRGNNRLIGIEAESTGTSDDWTAQQRESYPRGCAALLEHYRLSTARVIGHKEWTTRKIDPAFVDMPGFRRAVQVWRDRPAAPVPAPAPTPAGPALLEEDSAMQLQFRIDNGGVFREAVKVEAGGQGTPVADRAVLTLSAFLGAVHYVLTAWMWDGKPYRPDASWDGFDCAEGQHVGVDLPVGTRMVTVEGKTAQGAEPVASVWHLRDER